MARTTKRSSKTRWLNDEEEEAWRSFANAMHKLRWALECQLERDAHLSFIEYHALARLSEEPDHTLRMSELAEVTNASLSRLSHLVKRLESRGLVRREPDPADGRFTNAILTDKGYKKLLASAPGHVETVRDLVIDALSPAELQQLREASERMVARIDGPADYFPEHATMTAVPPPILLTVDDDPEVSRSLARDLRQQYGEDYRIRRAESGPAALDALKELKLRDEKVGLLLADHRMPEMTGVEFLEQAREFYPKARRVLLTAYADTDAAIGAINRADVHYYLLKPWDPPQEKLYRSSTTCSRTGRCRTGSSPTSGSAWSATAGRPLPMRSRTS